MDPMSWEAQTYTKCRIASYQPFTFVDGQGVRNSIYVSGCLFACKGCFNQAAQNFEYGTLFDDDFLTKIVQDCGHEAIQGITLLGGEPFLNTPVCLQIVQAIRRTYGNKKDIWAYSGYTFEQLLHGSADKQTLLSYVDVLVDGPFDIKKRDLNLAFRGSSNQRIVDVKTSLATQTCSLWTNNCDRSRQL